METYRYNPAQNIDSQPYTRLTREQRKRMLDEDLSELARVGKTTFNSGGIEHLFEFDLTVLKR